MVSFECRQGSQGVHWLVRWRTPDHKQHKKGGFTRKLDAEAWAAERITTAINHGTYIDPQDSKITINALGEQWLTSHTQWTPSYEHTIRLAWGKWVQPRWGDRRLDTIRNSEIQAWVNQISQERSATVVRRAYGILKGIYEMARKDHLITVTPTRDIELPRKQKREKNIYTPTQLTALAEASGEYKPLVYLLGLCGLRWGEATALTVEDLDTVNGTLRINKAVKDIAHKQQLGPPKTAKSIRTIYLPQIVLNLLIEQARDKKPHDLLFTDRNGEWIKLESTTKGHSGWLKRAMVKAGVPIYKAHDLRHTAASIAISSGANVYAVQRMLGHENASTTLNTYAALFEEDANNAAVRINDTMSKVVQHGGC